MKKFLGVLLLASAPALAGYDSTADVIVDLVNHEARGALSGARNSADATQRIYCKATYSTSGGWNGSCGATDVNDVNGYCSFSGSEGLARAALSIQGDSFVVFNWDKLGHCTAISVMQDSGNAPKKP